MLAIGGLLFCAALLMLAAAAPAFRSDHPPRWTTYGWVGEVVTLAIVCALALGIAAIAAGAIEAAQTGLDYLDLVLLAGVVVVAVAVRRWWKARARQEALGDANLRVVASDDRDRAGAGPAAPAVRTQVAQGQPPHRAA